MIKFGTGGWRALIGSEFIESNVRKVAEGICIMAKEQNKFDKPIVIGYDNRFLSDEAARWMMEVFAANGIVSLFIDTAVPTPLVMHTVQKNDLYFGIAITASHNPYIYNGVKLFVQEGRDAPIEITNRLEQIINHIRNEVTYLPLEKAEKYGYINRVSKPFASFVNDILNVLDIDSIQKASLKILLDPMYGSGYYPLNMILNTTQCVVDAIHAEHNAYFGHLAPAPSENTLTELTYKVVQGQYDIGIALDGDGDRIGIIAPSGRYLTANEILSMLYWYLHEIKGWKGPVVKNLATTYLLDVMAEDFGEKCYTVPVGFKHISHCIDKHDAVLGGESSGGLTVRGHIHGKDSIYAAALFVEMISVTGLSIEDILLNINKKYGNYYMAECNLHLSQDDFKRVNDIIKNNPPQNIVEGADTWEFYDGYKESGFNGHWILCRPSGTEPVLRIFAEAYTKAKAESYILKMRELLQI